MPRMVPNLTSDQINVIESVAEQKFYCSCVEQLPHNYVVLHSVNFITLLSGRQRDGEADFIIFCPDKGFIVVEIKGGGISFDPNSAQWSSENRHGKVNTIKNPFEQGKTEKYAILKIMQRYPEWNKLNLRKITVGHAAFFPDLSVTQLENLIMPESPREIMGGEQDLNNLLSWIDRIFSYWVGPDGFYPLGEAEMRFVDRVFSTPRNVKPLLSHVLRDEEKLRIQLTDQQFWYLRALGERKRAAITGGAGTGKTLLAIHKAQELARAGNKTLLVCYNSPLADHLKDVAGLDLKDNLHPLAFHELCTWRIRNVYSLTGVNLEEQAKKDYSNLDYFHVQMPYALALSTDYLPNDKYDAIIVDEGQDFRADYWMALEMLMKDEKDSYLYVFYDPNQALYQSADYVKTLMHGDYPLPLTMNCRNTTYIHNAAYRFYKGNSISPPKIEGEPIQTMISASLEDQRKQIHTVVADLIGKQGVEAKEIVILLAGQSFEKYGPLLIASILPKGVHYSLRKHRIPNTVLVESVGRFKGLEASIVILWGVDDFDLQEDKEALYVAFSRAKSRFFIVGTEIACENIITATF